MSGLGVQTFVRDTAGLKDQVACSNRREFALADGARLIWEGAEPLTLIATGQARVEVEFGAAASALLLVRDNAVVRITAQGASSPEVRVGGRAEVRARTLGRSRARFLAAGQARLTLATYEESAPWFEASEFSVSMVTVHENARPRGADWPPHWEARTADIYIGQALVCYETRTAAVAAVQALYRAWQQCRNRYVACMRTPGAIPKVCRNVVDFRLAGEVVHVELPGDENPRPWYSHDAHNLETLTEERRDACTRHYLDEA